MKRDLFKTRKWLHAFGLEAGRQTHKALEVMYCTEIALLRGRTQWVQLLINYQTYKLSKQT